MSETNNSDLIANAISAAQEPITPNVTGNNEEVQDQSIDTTDSVEEVIDTGVDTTDAGESERLYAGKYRTPEEIEQAYKEAERRMHEATLRARQLEEQLQAQQYEEYDEYDNDMTAGFVPTNQEELLDLAYSDPSAAMAFAAEQAPGLVPNVISAIRDIDPAKAEAFNQQWIEYRIHQQMQQYVAPFQQEAKKRMVQDVYNRVKAKPNFEQMKPKIAEFITQNPHLFNDNMPPQQIEKHLELAYYATMGENQNISAQAQAQVDAQRQMGNDGVIESDTQRVNIDLSSQENDPATAIKDAILAHNKRTTL